MDIIFARTLARALKQLNPIELKPPKGGIHRHSLDDETAFVSAVTEIGHLLLKENIEGFDLKAFFQACGVWAPKVGMNGTGVQNLNTEDRADG